MDFFGMTSDDSKQGKMADAKDPKSCLRWITDEQTVQRKESCGQGKQAVLESLDAQQQRQACVADFRRTVERVQGDKKDEVQSAFEDLKLVTSKRLECLQEVATVACLEDLIGMMSGEFSEKAASLVGHLSSQAPIVPDGDSKGLQSGAQNCILAVQRNWSWLQELVRCSDIHLQNASSFHQFYHTMYEYSSWMPLQIRAAVNKVSLRPGTKGSNWEAQVLLLDLKELLSVFLSWRTKLDKLFEQASSIVPVQLRTKTIKYFRPVNALTDYVTNDIDVKKGEELLLLDNSNSSDWLVRNVNDDESRVPSIICVVPGPDADAIQAALKIRLELLEIWTDNVKRVGKDVILFIILILRDWTEEEIAVLKAITFDRKDLIKSKFAEIITTLQPFWEDFGGFRELKERVRGLNTILAKDGSEDDRNEEYAEELVDRTNTSHDLVLTLCELWRQWDTYRVLLETSRGPEYMLLCERLDQLKYTSVEELRRLWQAQLQISSDDNETFEEWLAKQQDRWKGEGSYPAGGIGNADGYGSGQGPYKEGQYKAPGAWKFGGGMPGGFGSSPYGVSTSDLVLGPDGQPLRGPDGKPVVQQGTSPYLIGPDGRPIMGPDGKPLQSGQYLVGADGRAVLGPDGKPLPAWLVGPDGAPLLGVDGKPLAASQFLLGPDGRVILDPYGQPIPKYLLNASGEPILGKDGLPLVAFLIGPDGQPVLSADGRPVPAYVLTPDGKPVLGMDGKPLPACLTGSDGMPVLGADGCPIPAYLMDPSGKPILGKNGKPLLAYQIGLDGKPVVGKDGRPIFIGPDGKPIIGPNGEPLPAGNYVIGDDGYPVVGDDGWPVVAAVFPGADRTDGQQLLAAGEEEVVMAESVGGLQAAAPGQRASQTKRKVSGAQQKVETEASSTEYHTGESEVKKTFVITGVVNPKNGEVVSMHKAIMLGIIDNTAGTYNDNGNLIPIPVAMSAGYIKVEFTETKRTEEKKHDIGLITLKTHKESRPYSVKAVIDARNDERLSVDQAIRKGIIDSRRGLYVNPVDGAEVSLSDALDLGLLIVEFDTEAEMEAPEEIEKTYAIHAVVDQRRKERVSFSEAVQLNLLDKETGAYFHNVDNEYMYVGDAIRKGFIKATMVDDPDSMDIDPENRMVVEKVANMRRKLLMPMRALSAMKKAAASLGK